MSARLDELERLEKRGTPGPLWIDVEAHDESAPEIEVLTNRGADPSSRVGAALTQDAMLFVALRNAAPALLAIARAAEEADAHIFGNRDGMPEFDDWKWLTALQSALAALDGTPEGDS